MSELLPATIWVSEQTAMLCGIDGQNTTYLHQYIRADLAPPPAQAAPYDEQGICHDHGILGCDMCRKPAQAAPPREPTQKMIEVVTDGGVLDPHGTSFYPYPSVAAAIWRAMYDAAPQAAPKEVMRNADGPTVHDSSTGAA